MKVKEVEGWPLRAEPMNFLPYLGAGMCIELKSTTGSSPALERVLGHDGSWRFFAAQRQRRRCCRRSSHAGSRPTRCGASACSWIWLGTSGNTGSARRVFANSGGDAVGSLTLPSYNSGRSSPRNFTRKSRAVCAAGKLWPSSGSARGPGGTNQDPPPVPHPPPASTAGSPLSRWAQPAPPALQLDLAVDHRRRSGMAKRLDQPGRPGVARDQPRFQLNIDLKIQPIGHLVLRTVRVRLTTSRVQKQY